jgi:hypothetical protein
LVNLKEELTEIENKKSKSLTNPRQLKADGARKPLHNAYRLVLAAHVYFSLPVQCSYCMSVRKKPQEYGECSAHDWERSGLLGGIPRVVVQISALL